MNLEKIKDIVNSDHSNEYKESVIINILSEDKKIIPIILEMIQIERNRTEELILDSNAELSRALIVLKDKNLKCNKNIIADPKWVVGEIIKHYQKWKDYIRCNFNINELDSVEKININNKARQFLTSI
jgi:hypothetical protein